MGSASIKKGKVRAARYDSGATFESRPLRFLENITDFQFSFTEEEKKLGDFTNASGGTDSSSKRIGEITGYMDIRHLTPENLALALWGKSNVLGVVAVVSEAGYKIVPNMFIPTKRLINTTIAPVVKKGATVVAPADYVVTPGGLQIAAVISTATVISGDPITIDYTPKASSDIQGLTGSAPDMSIHVEGINEVDGKYSVGKFYKCKLGVAQNIQLIGDDFSTLRVSFTVQKDETISLSEKSQYFYFEEEA